MSSTCYGKVEMPQICNINLFKRIIWQILGQQWNTKSSEINFHDNIYVLLYINNIFVFSMHVHEFGMLRISLSKQVLQLNGKAVVILLFFSNCLLMKCTKLDIIILQVGVQRSFSVQSLVYATSSYLSKRKLLSPWVGIPMHQGINLKLCFVESFLKQFII